jgi:3-oxoadipate enol-lactonase
MLTGKKEVKMSQELQEFVLERKGCPLHYWFGGPQGAPLVVFTHGACVDHRSFKEQVPAVIEKYRVLTWDVRGHGLSRPMGEPFDVSLAVEDLLAIVDQLGYAKAVYVGHSNGTYIHQELVFRHPQRVEALVMADGTCTTWKHTRFEYWLLRASPSVLKLFPFEYLKKFGLPYMSLKKEVQDYIYEAYSMITREDYFIITAGAFTCLHYEPGYQITQPMLLVHGYDDRTGDIKTIAPLWAAREANCRYVVIPNARHLAILDNPEFFNRLLLEFLAKWVPAK